MITIFIDWLVDIITRFGYTGVFISVFIESFFAPIPSEIILPFSGFVASLGHMNIYVVIVVATVAAYLGSLPFYLIGRLGEDFFVKFLNRYGKYLFIEKSHVDNTFKLLEKRGNSIVFLGRLIPIVRTLISFPAGVSKMHFGIFSIYTLLGSLVWNSVLAYTGYVLGGSWEVVGQWVSKYEDAILILLIAVVVLYIGRGLYKRLRKVTK